MWDPEIIVQKEELTAAKEETIFESHLYGFRLRAQTDSMRHPEETAGPVTVSRLQETIDFEHGTLQGVLQVHCLPAGRRFNAPLLFDFLIEGEDSNHPIIDEYAHIKYEV